MPTITNRGEAPTTAPVAPIPAAPTEPKGQLDTDKGQGAPQGEQALSPKFASLARRERQLLDLDRKIKEREKAIEDRETKWKSQESDYIPKSQIKEKNIQILLEAGYSRDDIANMLLNGPLAESKNPSFVENELKKVREEIKLMEEKTDSKLQERDKASRDNAVKQITAQAQALLNGSPDEFEMIVKTGSPEVIAKFIEKTFDEEGVLMTVEEAAKFIEGELLQETLEHLKLKKVQEKAKLELFPQAAAPVLEAPKGPSIIPKQHHPLKTITNQMAAPSGRLTERDRVRRAVMRASGQDPDAG